MSLGPTNTDIEKMLSEAGAGENIDYSDNSQLKIYLQNQLNRFLNEGINSTSNSVKKFTHKEVSATFAKHLETITKK